MEKDKVIDTNLLMEGQTGLTTILNVVEYPKSLERDDLQIIWPTKDDYITAVELMVSLLESGTPIPAVDVLISAICLNREATLVTMDRHFEFVKAVNDELSLEVVNPRKKSR
jgi:tRNA(fMet)-specific endonuclease VapC